VDWTSPDCGALVVEYVFFAPSGFESSVLEAAVERDDFRLFELEEVVRVLG
jgi:hypothetical protein